MSNGLMGTLSVAAARSGVGTVMTEKGDRGKPGVSSCLGRSDISPICGDCRRI